MSRLLEKLVTGSVGSFDRREAVIELRRLGARASSIVPKLLATVARRYRPEDEYDMNKSPQEVQDQQRRDEAAQAAASVLAAIPTARAVRGLLDALDGKGEQPVESSIREAALEGLEGLGQRGVGLLLRAIGHRDSALASRSLEVPRSWVIESPESAARLLRHLSREESVPKRRAAALVVGVAGIAPRLAVPALERLLRDPHETVRAAAARALGSYGAAAVPALIRALRAEPLSTVVAAATALGRIGKLAAPARSSLRKILAKTKVARLRRAAQQALERIGAWPPFPRK